MSLYRRELQAHLRSLLIWIGVTGLFTLLAVPKFAVYMQNPELLQIMESMPQGLLRALNINAFSLLTVEGYIGLMHGYLALFAAIVGVIWGGGLVAAEERNKTADFTLSLPVTRAQVLTSKILASVTLLAAYILATWGMNEVAVRYLGATPEAERFLALSMMGQFFIGLTFLALGFFIACAAHPKRTGGWPLAFVFALYLLSLLKSMNEHLNFLQYLTPFQYFAPLDLYTNHRPSAFALVLTALWVIALVSGGYWVYNRRDIGA